MALALYGDILQIIEKSKVFTENVVVKIGIVGQRHQPTFIELLYFKKSLQVLFFIILLTKLTFLVRLARPSMKK